MKGVMVTMFQDFLAAAFFGALGGLGLGFLQNKGLEIPHISKEDEGRLIRLGFLHDVLIGAIAALVFYAMNPPDTPIRLVATGLTAGLTGSAILKGYVNGAVGAGRAHLATNYKKIAQMAMRGCDVTEDMQEMEKTEQQMRNRWPNML